MSPLELQRERSNPAFTGLTDRLLPYKVRKLEELCTAGGLIAGYLLFLGNCMRLSGHVLDFKRSTLLFGMVVFAWSSVFAEPVGYLQIDGRVDVQASGSAETAQISQTEYTVFAGDRIVTRDGSTVLTLDRGGALGLAPFSEALVIFDEANGELAVELDHGTLLFSLPSEMNSFRIELDNFVLRPQPRDPMALQVNSIRSDDLIGMVRRLDHGHIRVSVTDGELHVSSSRGSVYRIQAGNDIGLLAPSKAGQRINTQSSGDRIVSIEAPEQVGTNEQFRIRWNGQSGPAESYITIAPEGADPEEFERVMSTSEGNTLQFEAPGVEGDYEIRYVDGNTGEVSSFVYLQVVGERAVVPWIASNQALVAGVTIAAAGTGTVLLLDDDDDNGPASVSP